MSRTSSFSFTNTTANTHTVSPVNLGVVTNYALTQETANSAVLSNKTAAIDAEEIISYRSRLLDQIDNDLNIQNPSRVKKGIQYQIQVQDTLTTTDSDDPTFRLDEPIVASIIVRHGRSGNITADHVTQVVKRLLGAIVRADGTFRFDDLMRGAERPIVD